MWRLAETGYGFDRRLRKYIFLSSSVFTSEGNIGCSFSSDVGSVPGVQSRTANPLKKRHFSEICKSISCRHFNHQIRFLIFVWEKQPATELLATARLRNLSEPACPPPALASRDRNFQKQWKIISYKKGGKKISGVECQVTLNSITTKAGAAAAADPIKVLQYTRTK